MSLVDMVISPLSFVNLDFFGAISMDCMTSSFNFYHKLYGTFALPIVATVHFTSLCIAPLYCMTYYA